MLLTLQVLSTQAALYQLRHRQENGMEWVGTEYTFGQLPLLQGGKLARDARLEEADPTLSSLQVFIEPLHKSPLDARSAI